MQKIENPYQLQHFPFGTRITFSYNGGTHGDRRRFVEIVDGDVHGNFICEDLKLKMQGVKNFTRRFHPSKMMKVILIRAGSPQQQE